MILSHDIFISIITYILLIKEVILSVLAGTAHVLKEWSNVPLPVIHYYKKLFLNS